MATISVPNGKQLSVISVTKVQATSEKDQEILEACKVFFSHENRQKVAKLCELEDLNKTGFVPLMTFGRVLRYMGFRLLFEEIKKFVQLINVYIESKDRVFYGRIVSIILRKIFRPKPYLFFVKPSQTQAATKIQKFYLAKKNLWIRPGVRHPGVLMRELAKRLHEINKPLLKCFEQAEKNRCGFLEVIDLDQIFKTHSIETNFEETREVFRVIDKRQAGKVNYDNFITAFESYFFALSKIESDVPVSLQVKKIVTGLKDMFKATGLNCVQCFRMFDIGNFGVIAFDGFFDVLARIGFEYSQTEVRQVFDYVDTGKDNFLSFIEFAAAFFDLNESPIEILRRLEIEEQIRKEEEAKRLAEEERLRLIQEEENKKKAEEDAKNQEEEKGKKGKKGGKAGSKGGKKEGKAKTGKAEAGKAGGKAGKAGKAGKGGKAKTGKKEEPPPEPVIDENEIRLAALREELKKEFLEPIISTAFVQADYMMLAKAGQLKLENRPVDKFCYIHKENWTTETSNPMVTTLWISPELGQTGYLDTNGILKTHNLINGEEISVMHLGTKPPFEKIPIIGGACDSKLGRIYILNKQWVLEIWNLHEKNTAPVKRVKVLSKVVGCDYVQKYEVSQEYDAIPNLLSLAQNGVIIVNSTCADGFVYCFEPISLTLLWRSRLTLDEIKLAKPVLAAYEDFEVFIRSCIAQGKTEDDLYSLLNPNKTNKVTFSEFSSIIQKEKLVFKDTALKNLFKVLDPKNLGFVYLDKLFAGKYLKNLDFVKTDLDSSKLLPEWVNNLHANESVKDAMYRIFSIMEKKNMTASQLIEQIKTFPDMLPDDEYVSVEFFQKTLQDSLSPEITLTDLQIVIKAEDRESTGKVNFVSFFGSLTSKKLSPSVLLQLSSQSLPRDSLKYVLHKSIELGVDLYKKCKDLDTSASGTLPKEVFASILLLMPIGLDTETLSIIFERDLTFNSIGNIDYLEIFERQEYFQLLISSKKSEFLTPPLQEEAAVVQDFVFLQDLSLIAFTSINPTTSTIFLKDLNGNLICKLIGHFSTQPPLLYYCSESNTLISGETRLTEKNPSPFNVELPPSEILLWNLQLNLINSYKYNPPWVLKPYKKVFAHHGTFRSLTYLPLTQVLLTSGSDHKLKLWSITGLLFTLLEQEFIPLSNKVLSQHTQSNQMLTCVGSIDCSDCWKITVGKSGEKEWVVVICDGTNGASVKSLVFGRLKLVVPARQHDWEIPEGVRNKVFELFCQFKEKMLQGYEESVTEKREEVEKTVELWKNHEKMVQRVVVKAIVFQEGFEDVIKVVEGYPNRKEGVGVTPAEVYNVLVKYAGFYSITFPKFLFILSDIQERRFGRKITNKDEAAIVSLVRSLEESEGESEGVAEAIFKCICKCLKERNKSAFEMLSKLDVNQDKVLNVDEFSEFFKKIGLNLRKSEILSVMRTLDVQNSTTVNIQTFHKKLEDCGYSDPFFTNFYEYLWEDSSITSFIRKFKNQHKFRNFFEFFSYFDSNNDGFLTSSELLEALTFVYKKQAERISNILTTSLKNSLNCRALGDALENMSGFLQDLNKFESKYEVIEICIEKFNSLAETRNSVYSLLEISKNLLKNMNTGIEIHARKYRLAQGLKLLKSAKIVFQETIDRVLSVSLTKLNTQLLESYQKTENFSSGFALETKDLKNFAFDDLQIVWDNDLGIKEGEGKILESQENVLAVGYSQEVLSAEVGIGKFEEIIMKEVQTTLKLQEMSENVVKVLGICRVENENLNELWVIYEKPHSKSLKNIIEKNGGVLNIPITHKINAGKVLLVHWSEQILKILLFLQENSVILPSFSTNLLYFSEDFASFKIRLQILSYLDSTGQLSEFLPTHKFLQDQQLDTEDLAPEFYTSTSQGANCQVWNFALALLVIIFGETFPSFSSVYSSKAEEKGVKAELQTGLKPSRTFIYNPFAYIEIKGGKVSKNSTYELGLLKSLASQSFSGLISDFCIDKSESGQLDDLKTQIKSAVEQDAAKPSGLGEVFDLIFICLHIESTNRPTIQSLLSSDLFKLSEAQQKQAKVFAKIVFQHKNPNLVISKFIVEKLTDIESDSSGRSEELNELILSLNLTLLSYDDQVLKDTIEAVNLFDISELEKKEIINRNLVFPSTELLFQCIEDQVLQRLGKLSLQFAYKSEMKVLENFGELLKSLINYTNSVEVPILKQCFHVLQVFLQVFTGNSQLFSDSSILLQSYWKPEIFYQLSPLFKEIFNEDGQVASKFSGLASLQNKKFHSSYMSELHSIFENLSVLKNPESIIYQKLSALKAFRETLVSNNEHRLKAARDSKFVQFVVNFLQDDEPKLRCEALELFNQLSFVAKEQFLNEVPEIKPQVNTQRLIEFLVIKGQDESEGKSLTGCCFVLQYLKELSQCFKSPLFVYPIVRLIKIKAETAENKEIGIKLLVNLLQGEEGVQLACLSPFTDTLTTICNTLMAFAKNVEVKSGKNLGDVLQKCVEEFLVGASPMMLKAFRLAPGSDVVLKEQNLKIPDTISIGGLIQRTNIVFNVEDSYGQFLADLRNYLKTPNKPEAGLKEKIFKCFYYLQSCSNSVWNHLESSFNKTKTQLSSEQKKFYKETLRQIFAFFEYAVLHDIDHGWLLEIDNIEWIIEKSLKSIEHSGSDYDSFPFEQEGKICLKILCRLINRPSIQLILEKLVFGKVFVLHIKTQFQQLKEIMMKNQNPLEILEYNRELSQIRKKLLTNLLKFPNLAQQLVENGFCETLVRDFLSDKKQLQIPEDEFITEFISLKELFPIRCEAMEAIQKLFENRESLPNVFENLLENMKTHKVLLNEIKNIQDPNPFLSFASIEFLHDLVKTAENQISSLLVQAEAAKSLKTVLGKAPRLREKFPGLYEYSARLS